MGKFLRSFYRSSRRGQQRVRSRQLSLVLRNNLGTLLHPIPVSYGLKHLQPDIPVESEHKCYIA